MQGKFDVGLDVGSVSVNLVIMNPEGEVVKEVYRRHIGAPSRTALNLLESLEFPLENCRLLACTGMGGQRLAEILGGRFINEVIAQGRGTHHFAPQARTIIDMGGEDAKMIMVAEEEGHLIIEDFAMNTMCAAGTGSFLDQQAHRLGYSIEDFSELALKSTTPPRVAGRCSVFAKTDMIHLQQGATPDYEIIAGLCQAMARNLKSNIAKGKSFAPPIAFQGGVAHNLGVRQAFRQVFGLDESGLIIPPHFCALGAVGAVLVARENPPVDFHLDLNPLREHLLKDEDQSRRLPRLTPPKALGPDDYRVIDLPEDGSAFEQRRHDQLILGVRLDGDEVGQGDARGGRDAHERSRGALREGGGGGEERCAQHHGPGHARPVGDSLAPTGGCHHPRPPASALVPATGPFLAQPQEYA